MRFLEALIGQVRQMRFQRQQTPSNRALLRLGVAEIEDRANSFKHHWAEGIQMARSVSPSGRGIN